MEAELPSVLSSAKLISRIALIPRMRIRARLLVCWGTVAHSRWGFSLCYLLYTLAALPWTVCSRDSLLSDSSMPTETQKIVADHNTCLNHKRLDKSGTALPSWCKLVLRSASETHNKLWYKVRKPGARFAVGDSAAFTCWGLQTIPQIQLHLLTVLVQTSV